MIDLLFGKPSASTVNDSGWREMFGSRQTRSGQSVSQITALNYASVFCATRIIAESGSALPLILYRTTEGGNGREAATDHRWFNAIKNRPNSEMGSMAFRESRTAHQVNWGNGFAEIATEGGSPALWPIHPSRVRGDRTAGGNLMYLVREDNGQETALAPEQMLHIPGVLSEDGIWGRGIIPHASESIGLGLATEKHGSDFFGSGSRPDVLVTTSGLADPAKRQAARNEWNELYAKGGVAFFPQDADAKLLSVSNEAAQFLETRKFNKEEIATWYRLPPHMLGSMENATFSNIEQQSLDFVIYSLLPWLRRWEEQLDNKLLTSAERLAGMFFEHKIAGLLRGDIKTRYEAYKTAIGNGFMSINEVRRLENLNPIGPQGDQYYVPLNMTTADRMMIGEPAEGGNPMNQQNAESMFDQWTRGAIDANAVDEKLLARIELLEQATPATPAISSQPAATETLDHLAPAIVDIVGRMCRKESRAMKRAMRHQPDEFANIVKTFYAKHELVFLGAIASVVESAMLAGWEMDYPQAIDSHIETNMRAVQNLYDTATPVAFVAAVDGWAEALPETMAIELIKGAKRDV